MKKEKSTSDAMLPTNAPNDLLKISNALKDLKNSSIISLVDTTLINNMSKKIFKEKEELVLESLSNKIQHGTVIKNGKEKRLLWLSF